MKARKKVIQGGTWAGKTYGILAVLVDYAAKNQNKHITVVAETVPALKGGAIKQFKEIMTETGRWNEARWNNSDYFYKFANKTIIEFKSFDSVGKAQASGKRTDLFINEGPYIAYEIADALIMRTEENIWIDFNPTQEFWAHTQILPNNDAEFLLLKATDNEGLPATIQNELNIKLAKAKEEKEKGLPITSFWQNWCRVYVDGEIGNLQGVVFNNWEQCSDIPKGAEFISCGMDFGFTNDPTTCLKVYRFNGELYLKEYLYKTELTTSMLMAKLLEVGVSRNENIIADSADPKTIEELRQAGFKMESADKGPDSIRASIQHLQDYKIYVTSGSDNLIKELRSYRWKVDKSGASTNEPIDNFNHLIDALRYVALNGLMKKKMWEMY